MTLSGVIAYPSRSLAGRSFSDSLPFFTTPKGLMKTLLALIAASLALTAPALAKPVAFDVMATYAVPNIARTSPTSADGAYHIGLAIGPRFGNKLAVEPVANFLPKYTSAPGGRSTVRFGIMGVYALGKHLDLAAGAIQRPVADHGLPPNHPFAPVAGIALRL